MATNNGNETALERAQRVGCEAAKLGFDWPTVMGAMDKIEEEWAELRREIEGEGGKNRKRQELGDLLFAVVNVARHLNLEAEEALRKGVDRFEVRFQEMEQIAGGKARSLESMSLDEMEALWRKAKERVEGAT